MERHRLLAVWCLWIINRILLFSCEWPSLLSNPSAAGWYLSDWINCLLAHLFQIGGRKRQDFISDSQSKSPSIVIYASRNRAPGRTNQHSHTCFFDAISLIHILEKEYLLEDKRDHLTQFAWSHWSHFLAWQPSTRVASLWQGGAPCLFYCWLPTHCCCCSNSYCCWKTICSVIFLLCATATQGGGS